MKYFIILDSKNKVIGTQYTNNADNLIIDNKVEVNQETYESIFLDKFVYAYKNGKLVTTAIEGMIPVTNKAGRIDIIEEKVDLLLELQADILGGAI